MKFDDSKVKGFLPGSASVEHYDSIDSTNTELVRRVACGRAGIGDVVAAGVQTAGRGRHGNSFYSPDGGIYFSFAAKNTEGALPTVAAGVAVADTLERFGYDPEIKWVNDVLIGGKKVCGILAEAVSGTCLCVIGIGINLIESSLPEELSETAAALGRFCTQIPSREELVGNIVSRFFDLADEDTETVIDRYRRYLRFLGTDITVKNTGEICRAVDVTERGELTVRRSDGSLCTLNSGEISILIEK